MRIRILLAAVTLWMSAGLPCRAALPVQEETLGAWHYLYPSERTPPIPLPHTLRPSFPTAILFGSDKPVRVAALLPGSSILAEFQNGAWEDLRLPKEWTPLSLAADRHGKLYCLCQHAEAWLSEPAERKKRWLLGRGESAWDEAEPIPWNGVDRLQFDSENRLWALGTGPQVGYLAGGRWRSYTWSDELYSAFMPMQMLETEGAITLFSHANALPYDYMGGPRMPGILTFDHWRFRRDARADTKALRVEAHRVFQAVSDDSCFDRQHGYVCHGRPQYYYLNETQTVLRTTRLLLVSLGQKGLILARRSELESTPALAGDEWETLSDVTVQPTLDAAGNFWVGKGTDLCRIDAHGSVTMPGTIGPDSDLYLEFDPLGRPWVLHRWLRGGPVTVFSETSSLGYPTLLDALKGEAPALPAGRIFPFVIKTPSGALALGGPRTDDITIIDIRGVARSFEAPEIYPGQGRGHDRERTYNPFTGGEPWYDAQERIYTRVDGHPFVYDPAKAQWRAAGIAGPAPPSALSPQPRSFGEDARPESSGSAISSSSYSYRAYFRGFHFYQAGTDRPLDHGVNPLVFYPSRSGWPPSPGPSKPIIDPTGAIWIPDPKYYNQARHWMVLRKPAWQG